VRFLWLAPLAVVLLVVGLRGATGVAGGHQARIYLALGDSLAASMQPDADGHDRVTSHGYAEAVEDAREASIAGLKLVKLGRGGETAASMLRPARPGQSQLQQAEAALRSGHVAFVTLDIGANEVESCQAGTGFDAGCVKRGLATLRASLPQIIRGLRAAGGNALPIVGMNYYNSFLGRWVTGSDGRRVARASVPVERQINSTLATIYRHAGLPMADIASRFRTSSFGLVSTRSHGRVPLAVARTCRWTWACSTRYDDHTNTAGYQVIADTLLPLLPNA
jgi:lysophospholipase L1-like esterase